MDKRRRFNACGKTFGSWYKNIGLLQGLGLTALVALLFYRSVAGLIAGIAIVPFWNELYRREQMDKEKAKRANEFKEFLSLVAASLQTGYSLERAMTQAETEMKKLFEKSSIYKYIHVMNQKIAINTQVEKAFNEFAMSLGLEEAESLAEIISYAKKTGGDYGKHIKNSAIKIEEKIQVKQEIETITTSKRLELKVMSLMPMGIIAYIAISSNEFVAPLYGNPVGILVMTGCLLVYGAMIVLGRKIIDIHV